MELLIKNSNIIDWSQNFKGDIYIKDGLINEIGANLCKDCEIIDGEGLILMPSFIDLHCHFREPGYTHKEDIESGSRAAVRGGYTTVNLMANTKPICSSMSIVNEITRKAKEIGMVDVHQVVSITRNFDGKDTSHIDDIDDSVKIISEDGKDVMDSRIMMEAMFKAREKDIIVMCHSEDSTLSNINMRLAENTMTWRNITLAQYTGCKVHIAHVSTKESMEYIIEAKKKGLEVTCEVAPHHIGLTDKINYRVNPPIRKKEDVEFIIDAIQKGYVDAIATDHAPHTEEDKKNGAPGISGIETSFSVCYTKLVKEGYISLNKLSNIMSKNPASIMRVNKGEIKIGADGDLVLIDINKKYVISKNDFKSKGKNTPFEGQEVFGKVIKTIKSGKVVFSE